MSLVKYYPIASTVLIDLANAGHIVRMFQEKSSEGQSAVAYLMVIAALILWSEFYRIRTPNEKTAYWTAWFGVAFNLLVLGAVLYYR